MRILKKTPALCGAAFFCAAWMANRAVMKTVDTSMFIEEFSLNSISTLKVSKKPTSNVTT